MDWITILIFSILFLTGIAIGVVIGFPLGQRHILQAIFPDYHQQSKNISEAEAIK